MAFTYDDTTLATDDADLVRFLCGDTTDQGNQSLSDAEITYMLTLESDTTLVAIQACYRLAARLSKLVDVTDIGISLKLSQRRQAYLDQAKSLEEEIGSTSTLSAFVGGTSEAATDTVESNSDNIQPFFRNGMDTMPGRITSTKTSPDGDDYL